jgi:hypothetical protein
LRKLPFLTRCAVGAAFLTLGSASVAVAAPSISITVGADPAESITTQLGVTGTAVGSNNYVALTVKPAGGRGCGANYSADGGDSMVSAEVASGPYSKATNQTFQSSGSYLLCAWLNDDTQSGDPVVASASLTITVRPPHIALSISAPNRVTPGEAFQIATTAQAETSRTIDEYTEPSTGRGCPANAAAANSASGMSRVYWPGAGSEWGVLGGPFTETANETINSICSYLVCAYTEYPNSASVPEASATASISVAKPLPPCVVPKVTPGTSLKNVERKLRAAHCVVGKVGSTPSRTVHQGAVVRLSPSPGSKHAAGTPVSITVSSGPPCVVPPVNHGVSLKTEEHRIVAAHCAVGKISYLPSTRARRGAVIRLTPRPGTTLSPHAAVQVLVSSGRPRHRKR